MFVTRLRCMVAATVAVLAALAVPTVEVQAADLFTPRSMKRRRLDRPTISRYAAGW